MSDYFIFSPVTRGHP